MYRLSDYVIALSHTSPLLPRPLQPLNSSHVATDGSMSVNYNTDVR